VNPLGVKSCCPQVVCVGAAVPENAVVGSIPARFIKQIDASGEHAWIRWMVLGRAPMAVNAFGRRSPTVHRR
jgi:hypothetical protein